MNETYQNRITDQICKIQNDRALIAFYDRLRYAPLGNYAQLHAKGEYQENGHKVHSLICITIQDYSNGTGDRNIIWSYVKKKYKLNMPFFRLAYPAKASAFSSNAA